MSDAGPPGDDGNYRKLLALATSAKGDEPWDHNVQPMGEDVSRDTVCTRMFRHRSRISVKVACSITTLLQDRKWLEEALREMASDSDPIKQMKKLMTELDKYQQPKQEDAAQIGLLVEDLIDLVCHIDIALDFCKLGGLHLLHRFMVCLIGMGSA